MNKSKKMRLGALDVFIIAAVLVCAVSVGLRMFMTRSSDLDKNVQLDNYIISFEVEGIRDSSAKNYLKTGTNFYLDENDAFSHFSLVGKVRKNGTYIKVCF